jgi:hypothetical protein
MTSRNRIAMFVTLASLALGVPMFASAQDAAPARGQHVRGQREGRRGGGRGHEGRRGRDPEARIARMQQHLNLDAAQTASVRQLVTQAQAQHQALRNERLTQDERRTRHVAIMQATGQRIRAVLRADQQVRFDAHVARMQARRAERGAGRAARTGI